VAKIDAELTRLGKWHEFHVYRNTGHAFLNFNNAERYRHRAAQSAWPSLIAFFQEYLV
jgi:carboxymethylenebutenolidase